MGTNYDRFLHILSKWPVEINKKTLDYGQHLRLLVKKKDVDGNVFPGSSMENSKKLDSLLRLVNNTYSKKYPCSIKEGVSKTDPQYREEILNTGLRGKSADM